MNAWIEGARPRTLPAAVVPVLVGTAAAAGMAGFDGTGKGIVAWRFAAALVVSLALQVGVNYANDYSDGVRGTDDERVGPLRLVASGTKPASAVKRAAYLAFTVAGAAGLALAAATTWWLLAVGALAIAAAWFYTGGPRPYGYAGLGEVFVFVFFGVVATTGSAFVQIERLTPLTAGVSVPVGLLATALLVVNNLRDIPGDTVAGKRTLAVRLGDQPTRILYTALIGATYVTVPFLAGLSERPLAAAALFTVLLARPPVQKVLEGARGPALIPVLGATGRLQLVFGVVLAGGLWIGA
ncbi:MAG: 1,4-dihydroxy-2-naphthoate polyprenyltransferase [Acidimicrobiales bacterium]|nr:1,4-dihydroxy-2-naphthoate polyprenyltransferase [Acidimicrobiales bacterium]